MQVVTFNRGRAYSAINQHKKALADFDRALMIYPDFSEAYHKRGKAYYHLKNYTAALVDFRKYERMTDKLAPLMPATITALDNNA